MNHGEEEYRFYDPDAVIYRSRWNIIEGEDGNPCASELLDLSEFCIDVMKRRFKEAYHCLEDLTHKNMGDEEAYATYKNSERSLHKTRGIALLVGDILDSARRHSGTMGNACRWRVDLLSREYEAITEAQENILEEYRSVLKRT